jgi:hypothetical protein
MGQSYNSMPACLDNGDALLFSNNQNAPILRIADLPVLPVLPALSVLSNDLRLRWIVKYVH